MEVIEECAHLIKDSVMADLRSFRKSTFMLQRFQLLRLNGQCSAVPLAHVENMSIEMDPRTIQER